MIPSPHSQSTPRPRLHAAVAAVAVCCAFGPTVVARESGDVRFSERRDLPATGLRIRVMPGAVAVPLPPPERRPLVLETASGRVTMDVYRCADFWRRAEQAGDWRDTAGNRLILATITHIPPAELPATQSGIEAVEAAVAAARRSPPENWAEDTLGAWMQAFTGQKPLRVTREAPSSRRLSDLVRFDFKFDRLIAYAFRFNQRNLALAHAPDGWFVTLLITGKDTNSTQARKALLNVFLEHLEPLTPALTPAGPRQTHPHNAADDGVIESLKSGAESIRNLPDWWSLRTRYYVLISNLKPANRGVVSRIEREIDAVRDAFVKCIPPHAPTLPAGTIRIFSSSEQYRAYVPPTYAWSIGLWMPGHGELVINPLVSGRERTDTELFATLYHEALHQYLFAAFNQLTPSAWFNEGHAGLFETIKFNSRKEPRLLEHDRYLAVLTRMAAKAPLDVERLVKLSYDEFYAPQPDARMQNYALAWGLVYYLRKAAPIEPGKHYVRLADAYSAHLKSLRDPEQATARTFSGVDMGALSNDLTEFWLSASRRQKAESNLILK